MTAAEARDYGIIDDIILPRRGLCAPGSPSVARRTRTAGCERVNSACNRRHGAAISGPRAGFPHGRRGPRPERSSANGPGRDDRPAGP